MEYRKRRRWGREYRERKNRIKEEKRWKSGIGESKERGSCGRDMMIEEDGKRWTLGIGEAKENERQTGVWRITGKKRWKGGD